MVAQTKNYLHIKLTGHEDSLDKKLEKEFLKEDRFWHNVEELNKQPISQNNQVIIEIYKIMVHRISPVLIHHALVLCVCVSRFINLLLLISISTQFFIDAINIKTDFKRP